MPININQTAIGLFSFSKKHITKTKKSNKNKIKQKNICIEKCTVCVSTGAF